ncbi:fimbrial protein [Salmonella enterica subsp. enterica serovar Chester]
MKRMTILLLAASLLPSCVLAWNTPGEDFSGELKLGGPVTSTRNPWVWKVGEGNTQINTKAVSVLRSGEQVIPVPLPAMTVLLGKTILTTPAGREGLAPQVTYGKETEGFALTWTAPGVLRHVLGDRAEYAGLYDDLQGNGLPAQGQVMPAGQTPGVLQTLFDSEGPVWLREMTVSSVSGLSRFSDAALRQVDGVYGAQTVADSGELRFKGAVPSRWHTSLAVSIEYR